MSICGARPVGRAMLFNYNSVQAPVEFLGWFWFRKLGQPQTVFVLGGREYFPGLLELELQNGLPELLGLRLELRLAGAEVQLPLESRGLKSLRTHRGELPIVKIGLELVEPFLGLLAQFAGLLSGFRLLPGAVELRPE